LDRKFGPLRGSYPELQALRPAIGTDLTNRQPGEYRYRASQGFRDEKGGLKPPFSYVSRLFKTPFHKQPLTKATEHRSKAVPAFNSEESSTMRIFIALPLAVALPVPVLSAKLMAFLMPPQSVFACLVVASLTLLAAALAYMALKTMAETFRDLSQIESD
jgi:hypothetical protein